MKKQYLELLKISHAIYGLYQKLLDDREENKDLYKGFLKQLLNKEENLYCSLSKDELMEIKDILIKQFKFSFNGLFLDLFSKNKDIEPCILRVYRQVFIRNSFYSIQACSELNLEEAKDIIRNPYIEQIQHEFQFRQLYEMAVIIQLFMENWEDKYLAGYVYLAKDTDTFSLFQDLSSLKPVYAKLEKMNYLNAKNFTIKSKKLMNQALRFCDFSQMSEEIEEELDKTIVAYSDDLFEAQEFIDYDILLEDLVTIEFRIWRLYKLLVQSKLHNESKEHRGTYISFIYQELEKRNQILDEKVADMTHFKSYVNSIYVTRDRHIPFFSTKVAEVSDDNHLLNKEIELEFVREKVFNNILDYIEVSKSEQVNSEEETDTMVSDNYGELNYQIHRLEEILKLHTLYIQGLISEDEFKIKLGEFDFSYEEDVCDDYYELLETMNAKYVALLKQRLSQYKGTEFYDKLFLTIYIIYYMDLDIETLLNCDLDLSLAEDKIMDENGKEQSYDDFMMGYDTSYKPEEKGDVLYMEDSFAYQSFVNSFIDNIKENHVTPSPLVNITFDIYLDVLKEVLTEKDLQRIKKAYYKDNNKMKRKK